MGFPYGKAPLAILIIALITGGSLVAIQLGDTYEKPDLVFALFARLHHKAYLEVVPEFEKKHGVKIEMQLINARALQSRLQSAFLANQDVPDMVEILNGSMGFFAKGPIEDVGFLDLTKRIDDENFDEKLVSSRFSLWSSRGHIFALPHDVHPVALAYRADIVEDELGIDMSTIKTWDDFAEMGRSITKDLDGDGVIDRYALEMETNGANTLNILLLQRGGGLFNEAGEVVFDSDIVADTICWYLEQTFGPHPIGTTGGGGQSLTKAMIEGRLLFYFTPDWRTRTFQVDAASLEGKMKLAPLPVWEEGGRITSTWGGTGLAITKRCKNPDLAWEFAKFLYFNENDLGERFSQLNILPPLIGAWDGPAFSEPRPYYSDQAIGNILAELGRQTPPDYVHSYSPQARRKLDEAFSRSRIYYERNGDEGLREYVKKELTRTADYVRELVARNRFLQDKAEAQQDTKAGND